MKKLKDAKNVLLLTVLWLFMPFMVLDDAILKYFNVEFSYLEILELLNHDHDFQTSLSTLKCWLKDVNLKRRLLAAVYSSDEEILQTVQDQLNGSRVGYHRVYRALVHKGLVVRKHDVRLLIKEPDPEVVILRKKTTFMQT